jgi:hypothetical protein
MRGAGPEPVPVPVAAAVAAAVAVAVAAVAAVVVVPRAAPWSLLALPLLSLPALAPPCVVPLEVVLCQVRAPPDPPLWRLPTESREGLPPVLHPPLRAVASRLVRYGPRLGCPVVPPPPPPQPHRAHPWEVAPGAVGDLAAAAAAAPSPPRLQLQWAGQPVVASQLDPLEVVLPTVVQPGAEGGEGGQAPAPVAPYLRWNRRFWKRSCHLQRACPGTTSRVWTLPSSS